MHLAGPVAVSCPSPADRIAVRGPTRTAVARSSRPEPRRQSPSRVDARAEPRRQPAILTLSERAARANRTACERPSADTSGVDRSGAANQGETPWLALQRPDGLWWPEALLRAADHFSKTRGRAATLVLRRRPGLVARARAVADELDVE